MLKIRGYTVRWWLTRVVIIVKALISRSAFLCPKVLMGTKRLLRKLTKTFGQGEVGVIRYPGRTSTILQAQLGSLSSSWNLVALNLKIIVRKQSQLGEL